MLGSAQKGFAHIFMILLLLIGVGVGIYLVQNPAIFKPKADEDPTKCVVSDTTSLNKCFSDARFNQSIDKIEFTKQITCSSKAECTNVGSGGGLVLTERSRPLTIYGAPNSGAGIKRVNEYDYALLLISNSSPTNGAIVLKDLIFDEDVSANCPYTIGANNNIAKCSSTIALANSSDVVIDNIQVLHGKAHGIEVRKSKNITIKNSIMYDSGGEGIWFNDGTDESCRPSYDGSTLCPVTNNISKHIRIENNLIADSKVSALAYFAEGTDSNPNIVKGNLFVHNHMSSQYVVCPPPDPARGIVGRHCPGGVFAVANSKSTIIQDNILRDNSIDTIKPNDGFEPEPAGGRRYEDLGLHATGIELGYQLKNITIIHNQIYNNTGVGIFADFSNNECQGPGCPTRDYKIEGVNILQNVLYANQGGNFGRKITTAGGANSGVNNLDAPGFYTGGPTYSSNGNILDNPNDTNIPRIKKAFVFADPPVCELKAGKCETTIKWYSNDYPTVQLKSSGSLVASGPNYAQKINWISPGGTTFNLLDSTGTVLAQTFVGHPNSAGLNQGGQPSPTPVSTPTPTPTPTPSPSPVAALTPQGYMTATPNPCAKGASGLCSTTIKLNAAGKNNLQLFVNGNAMTGPGIDPTGSYPTGEWISESGVTFELKSDGNVIDRLVVKAAPGVRISYLSASPNPCRLSQGVCSSDIKLNAPGKTGLQIKIKELNNAPMTGVGADPTGTFNAPWINSTGYTFDLYSEGQLIDSVFVKGN